MGGAFISDLIEPPIPKIHYYGTEESPVHWRFLSSYIDGNNSDEYLVEMMDDLRTLYETVRLVSMATSTTCLSLPYIFNPGCFTMGLYANNLAQQLSQAVLTLDRSEAAWLSLIGALVENSEECYTVKEVVGWDYNKDGIYDEKDRIMRDSCEWENHVELDRDSIFITFDLPCEDESKIRKDDDSKERRPDPCHDFVELFAYNTYCYTIYEGESTDGLVVFHASKESNSTAWIEVNKMNHQELRLHPKGREHIEFLFRQEGIYSDGKFKFFEVNSLN